MTDFSKATPRPWDWSIEDFSMARLHGPNNMEDEVLSVSPCPSCCSHAKRKAAPGYPVFEWSTCTLPSQWDAALIVEAVNRYDALVQQNKELAEALQATAEALEEALGRLGVCGQGDGADHRADSESFGGTAALAQARAALKKSGIA